VIFLGHIIPAEGILVDFRKVEEILKWEKPINIIEIYSFIRLTGYYQGIFYHSYSHDLVDLERDKVGMD